MTNYTTIVDNLVNVKRQIERLQMQQAEYENQLLADADQRLSGSKRKMVRYNGTYGNQVTVTLAQKVTAQYEAMLPAILGKTYENLVQEKMTVTLTAPAKRLLGGISQRDYEKRSIASVIEELTSDPDTRTALGKRLKGKNPATDAKHIINALGVDQETADLYAYFVQEAAIWREFQSLLEINQKTEEEILEKVDAAIVCEEIPKLTIIKGEAYES